MRASRPRYADLTPEQKQRANARSTAHQALKRGRLARQDCERCADPKAQMHHDDYSQPLAVRWLCRACHARHHAATHKAVSFAGVLLAGGRGACLLPGSIFQPDPY